MTYYNYDSLEDLKDGDIIFFDEILNGNPVTLNACLTLLEQRRMVSGKKLPGVMIVAAANPQGAVPLTPQIKERFVWYDVVYDEPMWSAFMYKKYKMPKNVIFKLSKLIKDEKFENRNFYTPRSVDKATAMHLKGVPSPYSVVKDALSTLIKNPLKEEIDLPNGNKLGVNESIPWLNMFK